MNYVSKAALVGLSIVLCLPVKAMIMTHLEQAEAHPIKITKVTSDREIDNIVISNSTDGENFMVVDMPIKGLSQGLLSSVWSKKVNIHANLAPGRTLREIFGGEIPLIPGARVLDLKVTVWFDPPRYIKKEDGTYEQAPMGEDEYKITIISLDDVDEGSYTLHIDEDGAASLQKQKGFFG